MSEILRNGNIDNSSEETTQHIYTDEELEGLSEEELEELLQRIKGGNETPGSTAGESSGNEIVSEEEARETMNRIGGLPSAKQFFNKKFVLVVTVVVTAVITAISILNPNTMKDNFGPHYNAKAPTEVAGEYTPEETAETYSQEEVLQKLAEMNNQETVAETDEETEINETAEEKEKGIHDGYGEKGMWLSKNKTGEYAFADAKEVAEVCDNDECEMLKYTAHNQVESFADYLANIPEELQPEGFKGLSILDTEAKLESLSPEEYDTIQKQFDTIIDDAYTRRVTVNGEQNNAFMRLKDPSKPATHDNMELVKCTTNEDHLEVTQFYWLDGKGNEIGSMTVKVQPIYDNEGNNIGFGLCLQVINETDSPVYVGMTEIPDNPPINPTPDNPTPDEPTPNTPETPTEQIISKDYDNLTRIDNKINEDIADDIGTGEVTITPTPTETVESWPATSQPDSDSYEGTDPTILQNDTSTTAEPVQPSPGNDYSQNLGGVNDGEYNPVPEDTDAQQEADDNEIPIDEAPGAGGDNGGNLGELGIN